MNRIGSLDIWAGQPIPALRNGPDHDLFMRVEQGGFDSGAITFAWACKVGRVNHSGLFFVSILP